MERIQRKESVITRKGRTRKVMMRSKFVSGM